MDGQIVEELGKIILKEWKERERKVDIWEGRRKEKARVRKEGDR